MIDLIYRRSRPAEMASWGRIRFCLDLKWEGSMGSEIWGMGSGFRRRGVWAVFAASSSVGWFQMLER